MSHVESVSQERARWGWVRVGSEAVWRIEVKRGVRFVLVLIVRIFYLVRGFCMMFLIRTFHSCCLELRVLISVLVLSGRLLRAFH